MFFFSAKVTNLHYVPMRKYANLPMGECSDKVIKYSDNK